MQAARLGHPEAEMCAALRGEPVEPRDPEAFARLAVSEGVAPLLWRSGVLNAVPPSCVAVLREEVRCQLALATVREPELRRVLGRLADDGVDALVVKGAHVAYAFYEDPALRPRQDTDLLIRPGHEQAARRTLESLGYRRQPAITGAAVQGQAIFEHTVLPGSVLDVHWRLAAPVVAAEAFRFSELWNRARPIPSLGAAARGPHPYDAIAIAAVHLIAHHPHERGLLWLYDLRLLLAGLDENGTRGFVAEARDRKISCICAAALRKTEMCLPTASGAQILASLACNDSEPSAALIGARRPSGQALMDVRSLRGWRARTSYVAGHLFPPVDYMRRRYAPDSHAPLAWLYASRILRGAPKWLRRR